MYSMVCMYSTHAHRAREVVARVCPYAWCTCAARGRGGRAIGCCRRTGLGEALLLRVRDHVRELHPRLVRVEDVRERAREDALDRLHLVTCSNPAAARRKSERAASLKCAFSLANRRELAPPVASRSVRSVVRMGRPAPTVVSSPHCAPVFSIAAVQACSWRRGCARACAEIALRRYEITPRLCRCTPSTARVRRCRPFCWA